MYTEINKLLRRLDAGDMKLTPYVVMADGTEVLPQYEQKTDEKAKTASMSAKYEGLFRDTLYFTLKKDEILCRRVFESIAEEAFSVKELGVALTGITYGLAKRDDYFYHNENPRIYGALTFPIDYKRTAEDAKDSEFDIEAGNRWADPGVVSERIGASPYQPFPAIIISNYKTNVGLVHGSLSQKTCFHNYLADHEEDKIRLRILSSFKAIDALLVTPGRTVTDCWYLGKTEEADDYERIFAKYADELRKVLPANYGSSYINRDNMTWGTWNDGITRKVNEQLMLEEAAFIKENYPTVHWIQLDDGYAVYNKSAFGLGVPYEGEEGIDHNKFPHGLRYVTDRLREMGLRPSLWIGGFCPHPTKIYQEHPEWFIDYSYRVPKSSPLDVSQEEVREYMKKALHVLLEEYGFDGVKHDFWSYAFEDSHNLLKNKDKSGYEYRSWWLKELRNAMAKDGYLQTGCDIVMGNPFLGEYFTNYRYGIDISADNWDNMKTNYLWGIACYATHTGDLIVPNSDAIGLLPNCPEDVAMFWINYCLVSHTMVELAGKLSKTDDQHRLWVLKKASCNPNNGQDVYFINYDYRGSHYSVPEMLYFKTPHFSVKEMNPHMPQRTIGLFNLADEEKTYTFAPKDMGIAEGDYLLTDVWTGEQYEMNNTFSVEVPAHNSRLFAVSAKEGIQIYDANIRIVDACMCTGSLKLKTDYASKNAEITLSSPAKEVLFDGEAVAFENKGNVVCFDLPGAGTLEIRV